MRTLKSFIRYLLFVTFIIVFLAYCYSQENPWSAISDWLYWTIVITLSIIALAIEISVGALQAILFIALPKAIQNRVLADKELKKQTFKAGILSLYKKLTNTKAIEEEHEIILDHNYDGIQELDNKLPPWWVWGFYATILFAVIYFTRFQIVKDYTQAEEYETEVAQAEIAIAAWKKTAKNLVDINTVTFLSEAADLKAGKTIFDTRCVACHKADGGGGIGPNLTDAYWILGGGIKNVFKTISEGGRSGKGMIPWKTELKPLEMAQVASYVLNLQGTTPIDPKAAQGDIWKEDKTQ